MTATSKEIDRLRGALKVLRDWLETEPEYESCSCIGDDVTLLSEEVRDIITSHLPEKFHKDTGVMDS